MDFLDKALNALRLKGVFQQISGLIVGWFHRIEEVGNQGLLVRDLIQEVTRDTDFPILEIGDLGHNVENYVFPIGAKATMDTKDRIISIDESPVS